jgi:hypothetical protein
MTKRIYRIALVALAAVWLSATVARANLGTVTAGSISGVTITGGSITAGGGSEVFLGSDGIEIESGSGTANKIKWDDGTSLLGNSGTLFVAASSAVVFTSPTTSITGNVTMGSGKIVFLSGSGTIKNADWSGGGNRFACIDNDGALYTSPSACN